MLKRLLAQDYVILENLRTKQFQFEILGPEFAQQDNEAVMSSIDRLKNVFSENDARPSVSMTFASNVRDLERHESEFLNLPQFQKPVGLDQSNTWAACVC